MSGRWPIVVAMLAAVACSSAAAPYREYEIRFDAPAPPSLDQNPSDSELIDAIAWLMRHRLDLPFPADIKAYVYVNEATFVDGLVKIGGEKIDEAWDRGRFASGSGSSRAMPTGSSSRCSTCSDISPTPNRGTRSYAPSSDRRPRSSSSLTSRRSPAARPGPSR